MILSIYRIIVRVKSCAYKVIYRNPEILALTMYLVNNGSGYVCSCWTATCYCWGNKEMSLVFDWRQLPDQWQKKFCSLRYDKGCYLGHPPPFPCQSDFLYSWCLFFLQLLHLLSNSPSFISIIIQWSLLLLSLSPSFVYCNLQQGEIWNMAFSPMDWGRNRSLSYITLKES